MDHHLAARLIAQLQACGVQDVLALSKLGAGDALFWRAFQAGAAEEQAAEMYRALIADEARTRSAIQVRS